MRNNSIYRISFYPPYLSAQNIFVISQYPGFDPETTVYNTTTQNEAFAQNIETFGYPKPRTFSFGANITF